MGVGESESIMVLLDTFLSIAVVLGVSLLGKKSGFTPILGHVTSGLFLSLFCFNLTPLHASTKMEIQGLRDIVDRYDVFFLDMCGVISRPVVVKASTLTSGDAPLEVLPGALESLEFLRKNNKTVVLVTNAEHSSEGMEEKMNEWGVLSSEHFFKKVVTAGDVVLQAMEDEEKRLGCRLKVFVWGAENRVAHKKRFEFVCDLRQANVVLCTHLVRNVPKGSQYDLFNDEVDVFQKMKERDLLMFVPNNDLCSPTGKSFVHITPGFFAEKYEGVGGRVVRAGKPCRPIFDLAYSYVDGAPKNRIVMVGGTLRTDIMGAKEWGIDSILVRSGNQGSGCALHPASDIEPTWELESLKV